MSLIWTESGNIHGTSVVRYDSGSGISSLGTGRFEGSSFRLDNASLAKLGSPFANDPLMCSGLNFNFVQNNGLFRFCIVDGTTEQVRVDVASSATPGSGVINAYRGPGSTLLGTAGVTAVAGVWNYIDFDILVDPSAGYVKVYLNNVLVLNVTGANTRNTANSQANGFYLYGFINNGVFFDEWYVLNGQGSVGNARIGPKRVTSFDLAADGNSSQWTPSTGSSNYALVDERGTVNTGDYVSSENANDLDLYTLTGKSLPNIGFAGVNVITVAHESGLTSRQIRAALRSGGNDYFGATKDLTSAVLAYTNIWENNPDTSSPFTSSEIDALEIGQELVS